ncbi:MAG: hypothetical protein QM536_09435 [Chitinophagaceae bacterium]|nr:hypothetical protein [Chitinophagaceae bacterium]
MIQIHKIINTSEYYDSLGELHWIKDKIKCFHCYGRDCHKNRKGKSQAH